MVMTDFLNKIFLKIRSGKIKMNLGPEVKKMHNIRIYTGFYEKYCRGNGLDIGYRGMSMDPNMRPFLPNAKGIDLDTPGYDGLHLPCEDESLDFIFASHVLEHITDPIATLKEWHRTLKVGGHMLLFLPNCYLYEKSMRVGGAWNSCEDHKRIYTPSRLLNEVETALSPNTYRIDYFRDNDLNLDYERQPKDGVRFFDECFEIECVLKKIKKPTWDVE